MLSQERLRELLDYDPVTGVFRWKVERRRHGMHAKPGDVAGHRHIKGYLTIGIDGRKYLAHRLAWLFVYGASPRQIDHRDGKRDNNSIQNLRSATSAQNSANSARHRDGACGFKGVSRDGRRFSARIFRNGKRIHIGNFDTPEDAARAYEMTDLELSGDFARFP